MIPHPKLQQKRKEFAEKYEGFDLGLFSCLEMLAYNNDKSASKSLMRIALRCAGTSAISFVDSIEDMKQLFSSQKTQSVKLIENSFYKTPATKMIVSLMWP